MKTPLVLQKKKYMIQPPPKRPDQLKADKLKDTLTKDIKQMIGAMIKEKSEEKKDYWFSFIDKATKTEQELIKIVRQIFRDEEVEVLLNLDKEKTMKGRETLFLPSLADMATVWLANLLPFLKELIIKIGSEKLQEVKVGGQIDITTPAMVRFFNEDTASLVKGINKTTRKQLAKAIAEGFQLGESIDKIKNRVRNVYDNASKNRALMIARTETLRSSNFAAAQAFLQSGVVTGKEWLTTKDGRQDFACDELDGKIVDVNKDFVDKDSNITVGDDTLKIEADVGYPPLHTNCRCTIIPVVLET
jgi:hypothetical protein